MDWAQTPLGPVEGWATSLKTAAGLVLGSGFAMIVLWGPELIQVYNDAYIAFLGPRHPGALGIGNQACWPEVWSINAPIYDRVRAGATVTLQDAHYPVLRHGPDGPLEDLYITLSYSPAPDDGGTVGGVLVTLIDTTARVLNRLAAAERLRLVGVRETERHALLKAVFHRSPAFLAVYRGPEHVFALANEAYERLIGPGRDFLGKPLLEALPEVRGQGFDVLLDHVLATGESFVAQEIPVRLERTPGAPAEDRVVALTYLPLLDPDGERVGVIAHGTDVTEYVHARRDAERLIAESERARADAEAARAEAEDAGVRIARLQSLTATLAGARTLDDVGTIVVAEMVVELGALTGALSVLAASGDALELTRTVGFPDAVLQRVRVQPIDAPSPLTECFRSGRPVWVERRDGPEGLDARYPSIAPVWDELNVASAVFVPLVAAGEAVGVISFAFATPRTFALPERGFLLALGYQSALAVDRARLIDAEHSARKEAEAANRSKGDFLTTMSHELRTPLNAIGGYAELMEMGIRGPVTAEQTIDLQRIRRSQRHLLGLINGVLNYAKMDAGTVQYLLEDVQMDEVIATCEALIAPQLLAKRLTLEHRVVDCTLRARADRQKVQQVLLNLLANAVNFTEPGGTITVSCVADGDGTAAMTDAVRVIAIRVTDTGHGIATDQIERIFQPFVQLDARLTRTQGGTGLGLAISRDLARGMGGDLTVESTPGVGSRFTLTLPGA